MSTALPHTAHKLHHGLLYFHNGKCVNVISFSPTKSSHLSADCHDICTSCADAQYRISPTSVNRKQTTERSLFTPLTNLYMAFRLRQFSKNLKTVKKERGISSVQNCTQVGHRVHQIMATFHCHPQAHCGCSHRTHTNCCHYYIGFHPHRLRNMESANRQ